MDEWLARYPPRQFDGPDPEDSTRSGAHTTRPDKVRVDDTLDLHGYRLEEALATTGAFIDRAVENGYRKVLVIHGKGANGQGILRTQVRAYLEHHPMTGAMGYSRGAEGGRGALWVMLRDKRGRESASGRHRSR